MKSVLISFAILSVVCVPAFAKGGNSHSGSNYSNGQSYSGGSHNIRGYSKKDGTYVAPSHAKNPNDSKIDNWSTKGNVNPHTGKEGTKDPITGK